MTKDSNNKIDIDLVKMCLQANQHNALTSFYYLLALKLKINQQDEVIVPVGSQVKKYQSIEPQRTNLDESRVQ